MGLSLGAIGWLKPKKGKGGSAWKRFYFGTQTWGCGTLSNLNLQAALLRGPEKELASPHHLV